MKVEKFGERLICISGVGKLFYQEGYPISMSVTDLKKMGVDVSILHVADECLKNGWSAKTTYSKLISDFEDDIYGNNYDLSLLKDFCFAQYEDQREMMFKYLFGSSNAVNWLAGKLQS